MRFLSIGECMIEFAPVAESDAYHLGFAGDTFNTAWYLARLQPDSTVMFFTATGSDSISQRMLDAFAASGIDTTHVQTVPDRTVGLYLISLDHGERSFSYWRGQSAARELASNPQALTTATADADVVYFSGITLAILDVAARETLLTILLQARRSGKVIAFDPNLRPGLWPDSNTMTQSVMAGAAVSDVVLPSFEDEAQWFGDSSPAATADRYTAVGADTVVVKNGADAVHYVQSGKRGAVEVPPLSMLKDTTAAGDSFNAGILADYQTRAPLTESIERAIRLAGVVVQGQGALVGFDPLMVMS